MMVQLLEQLPPPRAIRYRMAESPFGSICLGTTRYGICFLGFPSSVAEARSELQHRYPQAALTTDDTMCESLLRRILTQWGNAAEQGAIPDSSSCLCLHLGGTPFQRTVWRRLMQLAPGRTITYAALAEQAGHPRAYRAVGRAVGANPVALLIPCHRVLPADGTLGLYHWGSHLKAAILQREGLTQFRAVPRHGEQSSHSSFA